MLGINIPTAPPMSAAPAPDSSEGDGTNAENDAAAAAAARRRLDEQKLKRGRQSVRIDSTSQTGGAGVAIAK